MKKTSLTPLIALAALLSVSCSLHAQPRYLDPVGARMVALGGTAAAMTYGADAVYHNPASLVWQSLTFGGGIQPVRFTQGPQSWWFSFYNRNSDFNVPVSLIAQGWEGTTDTDDHRHVNMAGMPLAFNLSPATPGAATVKVAFERTEDGGWKVGVPFDFGFLARHPSGAALGLVLRNVTIGPNDFEVLKERLDYGISWGGGPLTILASSSIGKHDKWTEVKDMYRIGVEASPEGQVSLRGGFIQDPDQWYATAGIGLRSGGTGNYEFSYGVLYDPEAKQFRHFLQYTFLIL